MSECVQPHPVVALRNLARRERVQHCGHGSYTKVFNYLQYQTSDGVWHMIPEVYEDTTEQDSSRIVSRPGPTAI